MPNQTETTIQQVAQELADAFESDTRTSDLKRVSEAFIQYVDVLPETDPMVNFAREVVQAKGDRFYKIKEGAPEWINSSLMHRVHQALDDRLPDDWVYEIAANVSSNLTEYDDLDAMRDATGEIADGLVDVYNNQRARWLASNLANAALVNEAVNEFGWDKDSGVFGAIFIGQYYAIEKITYALIAEIENEAEKREGK